MRRLVLSVCAVLLFVAAPVAVEGVVTGVAAAQDKTRAAKPRESAKTKKGSLAAKSGKKKVRAGKGRRSRGKRAARKRRRLRVSLAYRTMVRRWHARAPRGLIRKWEAQEPPPLVLRRVHKPVLIELVPGPDGTFSEEQCREAEEALASKKEGLTHEVHPRLLELVYRAALNFRAPYVHVVSGFRETRSSSRHAQGRAMDIVLPGVSNGRLARFFRKQGFVGVGIYPRSGFVHVDVRSSSYYWKDFSLPGAAQRPRPILSNQRAKNDARARKRGELAVPDLVTGDAPGAEFDEEAEVVTSGPVFVETDADGK